MKTLNEFLLEREIKATKSKPLTKEELKKMIDNNEDVTYVNTSEITNMLGLFKDNKNIVQLDLSNWDTSKVTVMTEMFKNCENLESVVFNDVTKVGVTIGMFEGCGKLKEVIIKDLPSIRNMSYMFKNCSLFFQDLNHWNPPKKILKFDTFKGSGLENNPPKWYYKDNK